MYFPQYLYHKQIHLGIQKHHESTQHIQRIQDIDLIDRFTMNQIISKNQNHIIHISIYPYLIYLYIYICISFHILNTCGFLMHPEPTPTCLRPVDPDRSRTSMVFIFKARSGMPLPRRRGGHGDPGEPAGFSHGMAPADLHRK